MRPTDGQKQAKSDESSLIFQEEYHLAGNYFRPQFPDIGKPIGTLKLRFSGRKWYQLLIWSLSSILLLLFSCQDHSGEYGTLVFKGITAENALKANRLQSEFETSLESGAYKMHTADLEVGIVGIWASQELVADGVSDQFTWYKIGEGDGLKSIPDYQFSADKIPAGEYKSIKISFRNRIIRHAVFQSDLSRTVLMDGSLNENGCGDNSVITQYFSKKGNHRLDESSVFRVVSTNESVRGFTILPEQTTTVYWYFGDGQWNMTDCVFDWVDVNGNQDWDCGVDSLVRFECNREIPMWSFQVDDGVGDPLVVHAVADIDGNWYNSVRIGNQVWLQSNLKTTRLNNGDSICPSLDWIVYCSNHICPPPSEALAPPLQLPINNSTELKQQYGLLYNWSAVRTGKLCPEGWHVPSQDEWNELITFLKSNQGGKLKASGTTYWQSPNTGATDEYDFCALPGGGLIHPNWSNMLNIGYTGTGQLAYFWSSSNEGSELFFNVPVIVLQQNSADIFSESFNDESHLSCRCLKD